MGCTTRILCVSQYDDILQVSKWMEQKLISFDFKKKKATFMGLSCITLDLSKNSAVAKADDIHLSLHVGLMAAISSLIT